MSSSCSQSSPVKWVSSERRTVSPHQGDLLLLVYHPRHEAQGHPSRHELLHVTVALPEVGWVMAGIGIDEPPTLGIEDGVHASDEHVGWDVGDQRVVRPLQDLRRREETLGQDTQNGAGRCHYQRSGYALVSHVPDD